MNMIAALLICCSLPFNITGLTPPVCGENLTSPEPRRVKEIWESLVAHDTRLPWYTSGFK